MYILSSEKIRAFAEEVLRLPVSMVTGEPDPDQVKVLLGEILDVWPASIYPGLGDPSDTRVASCAFADQPL